MFLLLWHAICILGDMHISQQYTEQYMYILNKWLTLLSHHGVYNIFIKNGTYFSLFHAPHLCLWNVFQLYKFIFIKINKVLLQFCNGVQLKTKY